MSKPAVGASSGFSAAGDVTLSVTVAASTNYVFACFVTGADPTSVKWNGVTMTQLLISDFIETSGSVNKAYIYGLVSPDTGTHNLVIDMPASQDVYGFFVEVSGIDVADAIEGSLLTSDASGASVTQTIANANNTYSFGIQFMATEDSGNTLFTPSSPSVELNEADTGTVNGKELHVGLAYSLFSAPHGAGNKSMIVAQDSVPGNGTEFEMVLLNGGIVTKSGVVGILIDQRRRNVLAR